MKHWHNLSDLLDLYGIDSKKGGGELFYYLVTVSRLVKQYGYTVRDVAAGLRIQARWSPMVFNSFIKRTLWPIFDASPTEWKELELEPAHNIYDLAEHIIDVLPGPAPAEMDTAGRMREVLEGLSVWPSGPTMPR